jgi:hypothetical protein
MKFCMGNGFCYLSTKVVSRVEDTYVWSNSWTVIIFSVNHIPLAIYIYRTPPITIIPYLSVFLSSSCRLPAMIIIIVTLVSSLSCGCGEDYV